MPTVNDTNVEKWTSSLDFLSTSSVFVLSISPFMYGFHRKQGMYVIGKVYHAL